MPNTQKILDQRIALFAEYFSSESAAIAGGLAVYLNTGIPRSTEDIDIVALDNSIVGRAMVPFQLRANVRVDATGPDLVFDSISLSDQKLRERAIRKKLDPKISYLGLEALLATKLTSLCSSGDADQPIRYGAKVLREKDIQDIVALTDKPIDLNLERELLETVQPLEEVDPRFFFDSAIRVVREGEGNLPFRKNAYGIARILAHPNVLDKESTYRHLREISKRYGVPDFAIFLDNSYHRVVRKRQS